MPRLAVLYRSLALRSGGSSELRCPVNGRGFGERALLGAEGTTQHIGRRAASRSAFEGATCGPPLCLQAGHIHHDPS